MCLAFLHSHSRREFRLGTPRLLPSPARQLACCRSPLIMLQCCSMKLVERLLYYYYLRPPVVVLWQWQAGGWAFRSTKTSLSCFLGCFKTYEANHVTFPIYSTSVRRQFPIVLHPLLLFNDLISLSYTANFILLRFSCSPLEFYFFLCATGRLNQGAYV
jgi:hypothetical protein